MKSSAGASIRGQYWLVSIFLSDQEEASCKMCCREGGREQGGRKSNFWLGRFFYLARQGKGFFCCNCIPPSLFSECTYAISNVPFTCQTVFDLSFLPPGSTISFLKNRWNGAWGTQNTKARVQKAFLRQRGCISWGSLCLPTVAVVSEEHINMPISNGSLFNLGVRRQKREYFFFFLLLPPLLHSLLYLDSN